jgi:hypothetical protein
VSASYSHHVDSNKLTGKGDPSNPSASAKDIQREKELDARLVDPPELPPHLSHEARRASRVDIDVSVILNIPDHGL